MIVAELAVALILAAAPAAPTPVEIVQVISKPVEREMKLPGELRPYLSVPLHSKVTGFVDQVNVDRGSTVKQGQVLITLVAPEMTAQIAEAESKVRALQLQQAEVEAKLGAVQSAYEAMKSVAADAPGSVAEVDLINAQKNADAVRAQMRAVGGSVLSVMPHPRVVVVADLKCSCGRRRAGEWVLLTGAVDLVGVPTAATGRARWGRCPGRPRRGPGGA